MRGLYMCGCQPGSVMRAGSRCSIAACVNAHAHVCVHVHAPLCACVCAHECACIFICLLWLDRVVSFGDQTKAWPTFVRAVPDFAALHCMAPKPPLPFKTFGTGTTDVPCTLYV